MKKLFLAFALLLSCASGFAQTAASYGFSAFSSPFASISATGTYLPVLSDDDVTEPSINIGFPFKYCGVTYNTLSACSNGWVSLTESPSSEWDNFDPFIDGPGWLMPYWDDLDGFVGLGAFYSTTGLAPNRVFTLEWNTFESVVGFGDITFQIKLHETTNIIDFHYGPSTLIGSDATMGISNDNVSDWQTLSDESTAPVAVPSPLFIADIFGTPLDGQVYRWTPSSCVVSTISGGLTTCPGGTTALSNATIGGAWSSSTPAAGTISAAGVVTGIAAGTTTITYTATPGCYATAVVTVNAPAAITGTPQVCTGSTTILGSTTPGGTWSSVTSSVATVDASSGTITGITPGTTTINYNLPGGCVSSVVATVDATPAAITGTLSTCQGTNTALASATIGGAWSSSLTGVATIDAATGVATGMGGGITTISYTMPTGCYSLASLTVNPTPGAIGGGSSTCLSGTLSLTSTTFGGTWTSTLPATATVNASTGVVTGIAAGTTMISYTLASGCFATLVVSVTSVVAPIIGSFTVCKNASTTLGCITPGGSWSNSTPLVATINTATGAYFGVSAGTATMSYVLGSGCYATTEVTVNPAEPITGTATVCPGSTTSLFNTVTSGTWSSSVPANCTINTSGIVTGINAGTSTIGYLNPSGCSVFTTVTVYPLPSAITGDMHICVGTTSTLNSTPAGGAWSHTPLGAATVNAASGVVTGVSAGVNGITYLVPATGCTTTANVTVDPAPTAITGTMVLCPGTTNALGHGTAGGTWASSNTAIVTVNASGAITGIATAGGTATISYTLPLSGCIATTVVTVLPLPAVIGGSLGTCIGATTTLTSTPGSTWASSNTVVATIGSATGIVAGLTNGTSTITATGPNGCTRTAVVTVNPNPGPVTGTATVCVGLTTTLSSTPGGGTWSSSNLSIATVSGGGVVGGITNGTSRITYTRLGCIATGIVTVNPLPANFTPAAPNTVCIGLTTTLNSTPGGTWTSSDVSTADIGSATGIITGYTPGTASITYTLATGCIRARTVTVNDLPGAIVGATIVCPGTSITLTSTPAGGTWSSSLPAIASVAAGTGVVTGIAGGATVIRYTLGTGCTQTFTVNVITAPIAAITPIGDTILCPGDFVTLTSSAAVGATYQWYNGGVLMPAVTGPTYITGTAGSYQVRVSIAAGCTTLSVPMTVTVVPATATISVPGGTTSTCAGAPVVLNANTGVGLTYQWELGGAPVSGATASTYNALLGGSYTVRVTNSAGCWAVSAPVAVVVSPAPSNVVSASGSLTFCNGSSVTFTSAAGAGFTYQWYNTAGPIPGATGVFYTATTASDYHVVVSNGACTATSAISTTVVNPLPNVSITPGGTRVFCAGSNVLLDATPGFTYQWYRDGAAIAGATNQAYLAMVGGGYRVQVTNPVTGCSDMTHADTVVTVISSPSALPLTPAKFCWGGSSLLSTSVSGLGSALAYQWFFNGVPIPGATAASYSAAATGGYHCRISVPGSCNVTTNAVTVTEMPLPDPPITFNGTIFSTSNFYVTYQWYKNLVPISGATSFTTPATSDGNYKVAVTDTNGCQSVSAVYVLSGWKGGSGTGVTDVNSVDVRIYPNPARMTVNIECASRVRAVVSGIDGRALINVSDAKTLDISNLADGMYLISVYADDNTLIKTQKLIKRAE